MIFLVVNSRTGQFPFSFQELSSLGIPILSQADLFALLYARKTMVRFHLLEA